MRTALFTAVARVWFPLAAETFNLTVIPPHHYQTYRCRVSSVRGAKKWASHVIGPAYLDGEWRRERGTIHWRRHLLYGGYLLLTLEPIAHAPLPRPFTPPATENAAAAGLARTRAAR